MKSTNKKSWFVLGLVFVIFNFAFLIAPSEAHALQLLVGVAGGALGFLVGGPAGIGLGFAIGSFLGGLFFGPKAPTVRGPRLSDKTVQSSAYGAYKIHRFGRDRVPAQLIFSSGLKETAHKTEVGGKGMPGGSQTAITYTYSVDLMLSFGDAQEGDVLWQLWADTKLIVDNTGTVSIKKKWAKEGKKFVTRDGNESQLPSALEESYHGAGNCSAHRGLFCLEAEDFQLADFANRIPNFTAVIGPADKSFQKIESYVPPDPPYSWWTGSGSYLDPNGELWVMYFPASTPYPYAGYAKVFHWTLDKPSDPLEEFHPLLAGTVTQTASVHGYARVRSDEPSAAAWGTNNESVAISYFGLASGVTINFDGSGLGGIGSPTFLVKFSDDVYFAWFTTGSPTLVKFDGGGAVVAQNTDLFDDLGISNPTDMGFSESYIWALTSEIIKIDPDDMSIISHVPITGTTGNILAMSVVSDSEIRLFTAGADGSRFYIVDPATGVATLDKYAPTEGYPGIRGFGRWSLSYGGGMYLVQFGGYIGGFAALNDFFAETADERQIRLWEAVRDLNIMAGLDSVVDSVPPIVGDIDVDELTDILPGYSLTRAMPAREALEQLQQAYFFDGVETDGKLRYPKRGKAAVRSIPGDDLAARTSLTEALPDRLTQTRVRESEVPRRVHVIFNNKDADYQQCHEYASREITDSQSTMTIELAVAMDSTKARQIAQTWQMLELLERDKFTAKTSRKHLRLDAADNVEVVITEQ